MPTSKPRQKPADKSHADKDPTAEPAMPAAPEPVLDRGYGDEHGGYIVDPEAEGDPDARPGHGA